MFLNLNEIHTFFGKSHILQGVSLQIGNEEIVALLGRNGVGKSTTLKSIMGLTPPQSGSIRFKGREIIGMRPFKICRLGIGYVPEERRIFPYLTVRQNLLLGVKSGQKVDHPWTIDRIYGYFPRLEKRDHIKAKNLSGGEQQMLAIGRTLMGNPEILLVDEPTEGLAPLLVEMVGQILLEINKAGCSIIIVEQAIDIALTLAKRTYVMNKGAIVFEGTVEEFKADENIRRKYLQV